MAVAKSNGIQWRTLLRRLSVTLLSLIAGLVLVLLIGYQLLPIRQLQWSGVSLGSQQIRLTALSFQLGQGRQWWEVQVQQLAMDWRGWPLPLLSAQKLKLAPLLVADEKVEVPPVIPADDSNAPAEFQLPLWPDLTIPGWLPQQLDIRELFLQLPCQSSQRQFCQLQGSLQAIAGSNNHTMDLHLQGDGQQIQLQFDFMNKVQKLTELHVRQLLLQLDIKALTSAGWIKGLPAGLVPAMIQLQLQGHWNADGVQLSLLQPLQVEFSYQQPAEEGGSMQTPMAQLLLQSGNLQCPKASWQQCQLTLDAAANVRQFQHPMLQTSDWQWQGQAQGTLTDLKLIGTLQNPQALKLSYQAELSPSMLKVQWQLADLFLLAGNPLQITRLWPELLELQRGKISAEGQLQLQLPAGKMNNVQLKAKLSELYGIYDRTAFAGLTARLLLDGDPRSFTLQLTELALKQINHGFQAGPAKLAGEYRADWSTPTKGEVRLKQAQMVIFGGQLALAETQFNLQQPTIEFRMAVQQIQLAEVLKQHPSSRMLGDGVLSGIIPLRYQQVKPVASKQSIAQWQVFGGHLQAEAPGGRLQYQYHPVAGQKASGMDVAWEALSDFRYQMLASTVELQPDGKVLLGVKLHGFNPKLQQGRPVHFNINVEEDLPALLTSLQLSGQISDRVRQRIQQKLQQQEFEKTTQRSTQQPKQQPAGKSALPIKQ